VSWASGGDYIGWCPLGYRDRPVRAWGGRSDRASLRGGRDDAWSFVRRGDLGARDLGRRRLDSATAELQVARVIESPHARPTRDLREFRLIEPGAAPRGVRVKPTPGDTVPELAVDRQTTIPSTLRTRPREADSVRRYDRREDGGVAGGAAARAPAPRPAEATAERDGERATDQRSPRARPTRGTEGSPDAAPRRPEPERLAPADRGRDGEGSGRFFRPLSEPRPRPRDGGERSRPRGESTEGRDRTPNQDRDRDRSEGGSSRGMRSAPREERPPARVEPRRSEPSRAPASSRPDRAAPRSRDGGRERRR
jgi:hypothetical protein